MKTRYILLFCLFTQFIAFSQGCSDAGICSIGGINETYSIENKNQLEVTSVFGAGESDVTYISPFISYTRNFNKQWSSAVKITSSFAQGSFGQRGSISDAFLATSYKTNQKKDIRWVYTAAVKIPFNRANLKINEHSLPMAYQSSLGTFDFIGSINFGYKKWDFNAAFQVPVVNINANSYFDEYSATDDFPSTNLFERKPDALLRGTYTITTPNKKFSFRPNLLFIYHLGEDTFENIYGVRESIAGSDGLTVNGNLISAYHFKKSSIELSLATPFVVREVRPDGLTRAFTAAISYNIQF